jgi:hypothetical protein
MIETVKYDQEEGAVYWMNQSNDNEGVLNQFSGSTEYHE